MSKAKTTILYLSIQFVLFLSPTFLEAKTINVPGDQPTIQRGIDAAFFKDTILVAPGTYYENIRYFGKNIVVTSHFIIDMDPKYIYSTIIDGSQPYHPDTASVVRIIDYENNRAQLVGFTITGGTGTNWPDPHGFGDFREGGGILCEFSSPVIKYNLIINNQATLKPLGIRSSGGGGIRCGDGDPQILNNIIMFNQGKYGAGVVLNYAKGTLKNNVIAFNKGGQAFGGSGVWKYAGENGLLENNTIVYNSSVKSGGGVYTEGVSVTQRNNILWGNTPDQIKGPMSVTYSIVEGGRSGVGNLDIDPELFGNYFYTKTSSPGTDAGNPDPVYNDIENSSSPGTPLWPAFGNLTNDIGAYGGPGGFPFEMTQLFCDIQAGWTPLSVNFEAYSRIPIDSWLIDYGDGASGSEPLSSHTYNEPGLFDVELTASSGSEQHHSINEGFIASIADSMKLSDVEGNPGEKLTVEIYGKNTVPLISYDVPIQLTGNIRLKMDSASTYGCRNSDINKSYMLVYRSSIGQFVFQVRNKDNPGQVALEPGEGVILKIYFTIHATAENAQFTAIDFAPVDDFLPEFFSSYLDYEVIQSGGSISVVIPPCCFGMRGNIDLLDEIDIADLAYLTNYIFKDGSGPDCPDEADLNGIDGVDVSDLVYIVNYIFKEGVDPLMCP